MSIRDSESIPNSSSEEDDYEDVEEIEVYEEGFSDTEEDREEKKGKDDAGYSDGEVERRKGIPNGDDGFDGIKNDFISSKPELQTGHNSVSDRKEIDQSHQTTVISEKHTIFLDGGRPKPLAGENADSSNVELVHPSAYVNHLGGENTKSLDFDRAKSEIPIMIRKDLDLKKEAKGLTKKIQLQAVSEKPKLQRSRSPSADAAIETIHKRPALMICNFFRKGWCIKGNACRFLHQIDGAENNGENTTREPHEMESNAGFIGETEASEIPPSSSNLFFHRSLVRTYGNEKQGEGFSTGSVRSIRQSPFTNGRSNSTFNHLYGRPNTYRDFSSGLNERMLCENMAAPDHLDGRFSSRNTLLMGNSKVPDPRFSPSSPSIYHNRMHDPFHNEKYTLDRSLLMQRNQYESGNLYRAEISNPARPRSFHYRHLQISSHGHHYASQRNDLLNVNNTLQFDKGYHSRSYSTLGKYPVQNIPQEPQVFMNRKAQHMEKSNWEPSMRFCSSFDSSSGIKFDHQMASFESPTGLCANTHLVARERHSLRETVSRSHASSDVSSGHLMNEHVSVPTELPFRIPSEERNWVTSAVDISNTTPMGYNMRNQEEEYRKTKQFKVLKFFRDALIEFVKDLLKPSWREGHLSKDSHKMIVKKAVEKVLGTLQPQQIPNDAESISQYFSISRPKITKLVEGYIEKYKFGNQ